MSKLPEGVVDYLSLKFAARVVFVVVLALGSTALCLILGMPK